MNLKDVKESLLSLHTQHEQKKRQLENLLGTIDKMLTRKPRSQEPDFHTSVVSLQTYFPSTLECMHLQSYEARCPKTCRLFLQNRAATGRIYWQKNCKARQHFDELEYHWWRRTVWWWCFVPGWRGQGQRHRRFSIRSVCVRVVCGDVIFLLSRTPHKYMKHHDILQYVCM